MYGLNDIQVMNLLACSLSNQGKPTRLATEPLRIKEHIRRIVEPLVADRLDSFLPKIIGHDSGEKQ